MGDYNPSKHRCFFYSVKPGRGVGRRPSFHLFPLLLGEKTKRKTDLISNLSNNSFASLTDFYLDRPRVKSQTASLTPHMIETTKTRTVRSRRRSVSVKSSLQNLSGIILSSKHLNYLLLLKERSFCRNRVKWQTSVF